MQDLCYIKMREARGLMVIKFVNTLPSQTILTRLTVDGYISQQIETPLRLYDQFKP